MKYMHFNSSCPYAGMANMLELQGFETEDYKIARDMGLPYFLRYDKESKSYQAGPMLQSAEWFNLYLKPRGFCYIEQYISREEVLQTLNPGSMLGIWVTPQSKHAVVFLGEENGVYRFLNNKWENSEEPDYLELSAEECLNRLPEQIVVGHLERCEAEEVDLLPYYEESLANWDKLRKELQQFVLEIQSPQVLRESMNKLFRVLLLDGLSMVKLLKEQELAECLEDLQKKYLGAVRKNGAVRLADEFDCGELDRGIDGLLKLTKEQLRKEGDSDADTSCCVER